MQNLNEDLSMVKSLIISASKLGMIESKIDEIIQFIETTNELSYMRGRLDILKEVK